MRQATAAACRGIAAGLLWLLLAGGPMPALGQGLENQVTVSRPAPGQTVRIQLEAGKTYVLNFAPGEAAVQLQGQDYIVAFDDDGDGAADSRIVFLDMLTVAESGDPPLFRIAGADIRTDVLVSQAVELASGGETLSDVASTPQSPGNFGGGGPLSIYNLRVTGRDLLFPDMKERSGHPLYSYLLFAGAREGTRDERARFRSAIQAFVGQFSPVEVLLEPNGFARNEINVFYAPIKRVTSFIPPPSRSGYFFDLSTEKQAAVLEEFYDYDRAEILIRRMLLSGNGPFIVSVLRPLSEHPVREDEAFLVQDLSGVPPELVALWVDEFKRQVVREATGSPEHLRRLALNLRTQIAVLAEAFSITKSAVAEMFEAPDAPGGDGN